MRRNTCGALVALVIGVACATASAFEPVEGGAQLRDAVVDSARGAVWIAAYSRGEVRRVDAATGETLAAIPVGRGPAALALSQDGATLACVNRLDGTLTLIDVATGTVLGTAPCDDGACDVAPLADGRFVVVNSFADSLTLVSPASPNAPTTVAGAASVPSAVAAVGDGFAVAVRVPSAVLLYAAGSATPRAQAALPAPATRLAAAGPDRVAAVTDAGIVLVDATDGSVVRTASVAARDVAFVAGRIQVLTADGIQEYDADLTNPRAVSGSPSGQALAADGITTVVLDPTLTTFHLAASGAAPAPAPAASPAPAPTPAPAAEAEVLPVMEAAPVEPEPAESLPLDALEAATEPESEPEPEPLPTQSSSPEPEPTFAQPAAPSPEPASVGGATVEPEPAPLSAAEPDEPATDAPVRRTQGLRISGRMDAPLPGETPTVLEAEGDEAAAEAERRAAWRRVRPSALEGLETRAPRFSRTAPGPPGEDLERRSLSDVLSSGINVATEGSGFERPDPRQPLEDITADRLEKSIEGNEIRAEGDVRMTMGDLQFAADSFYYREETLEDPGEFDATGNVLLLQPNARVMAHRVVYRVPPRSSVVADPEALPLESPDSIEAAGQEALMKGSFLAERLQLSEPLRGVTADELYYDFSTQTGYADNARGIVVVDISGQPTALRFGAGRLDITGPESASAQDFWITTSEQDPPLYSLFLKEASIENGELVTGEHARLKLGKLNTPLYWPKWSYRIRGRRAMAFDFDSGRGADTGYYVNYAHYFFPTPNIDVGLRLHPTEKLGVGVGVEGRYDFMETPASPLFRGQGAFRTMLTTKDDNGRAEFYHRHELDEDTILRLQWEQWFEPDFVKDFYYDEYRHRTEPRTFANVTRTRPDYIATATVRATTNDFVTETERLPEVTFHLLERPVLDRLYFTYDMVTGYNEREPSGTHSGRSVHVARVTADLDVPSALSLTPFAEVEAAYYTNTLNDGDHDLRLSAMTGITAQTRFQRAYPGAIGFDGFRHVIVPSMTYSYRPEPAMGVDETPRFDTYDNVYGRSRLETKIDNVVFARDAESGESWQAARLSVFHGTDFWNELRRTEDYEIELDIRPRPWWGVLTAAERHNSHGDENLDTDAPYYLERRALQVIDRLGIERISPEVLFRYNAMYADYDRILSYVYYDDRVYEGRFNARLGFAYTKTRNEVFNREVLYGMGYRLNDKWSVAFEHRYDFERDDLYRQTYEIRRNIDGLEATFQFRERREGWDVGFELGLAAFPRTRLKF